MKLKFKYSVTCFQDDESSSRLYNVQCPNGICFTTAHPILKYVEDFVEETRMKYNKKGEYYNSSIRVNVADSFNFKVSDALSKIGFLKETTFSRVDNVCYSYIWIMPDKDFDVCANLLVDKLFWMANDKDLPISLQSMAGIIKEKIVASPRKMDIELTQKDGLGVLDIVVKCCEKVKSEEGNSNERKEV